MSEDITAEMGLDKFTSTSPPASNRWMAVFSVALTASVFCTTEFLPVGIIRYISRDMGIGEGSAGLMVTAPGLLAAFAAPLITVLVKSRDRRLVLLWLGMLLIASNLIAMLATSFPLLILGRVLFGIGLGGFWAIGAGLAGRLVEEQHVGRATSTIFAGVSVGMLVGGPMGALLGDLFGWRVAFGAVLALSVVSFFLQLAMLPSLRAAKSVRPQDLLGIVQTQAGRIGLLAMFLVLCGQFATYTYLTPFLAQVSGFSGPVISSLLLGYTAVGLFGNFVGGAGASRSLKWTFLATIAFVGLPLLALPLLGASQGWTIVLLAVWGLSYGAMPVALQMWMARAAPEVHEGGMALFVANFQISIAIGSFVGGVIVDGFGLFAAMYAGAAISAISAIVLVIFSPRRGVQGNA